MTTEPIALTSLIKESISAMIKLLVLVGLVAVDAEQLAAILLVVDTLLALAAAIYARTRSTPTAAPVLPVATPVTTPTGEPAVVVSAT